MAMHVKLLEPMELTGYWWLPSMPDCKVPGTMSFEPKKDITVELDGTLMRNRHGMYQKWPVVHGETRDGIPCSLLHVLEQSKSIGSHKTSSRISADYGLLGVLFSSAEETVFRSAAVDYTGLTAWMGRRPFDQDLNFHSTKDRQVTVSYTKPRIVRYSVHQQAFTVKFGGWFSYGNPTFQEITMEYGESAVLRPKRSQSLFWFLDKFRQLRNLLSLLMAEPVFIEHISLESGCHLNKDMGRMIKDYAQLLICQRDYEQKSRFLHSFEMPLPYPVVKKFLQNILDIWFSRYDALKPTYDLFFLPIYNRHLNIEFQFLGLVQALEAFHRIKYAETYLTAGKYDGVRTVLTNCIPRDIPSGLRAALESRLKYGNEYSLRKRLKQMATSLSKESANLVDPVLRSFLERVVDTRNYLTHHDHTLAGKAMPVSDMLAANSTLRLFLMLLIFKEIGIPEAVARDVISKTSRLGRSKAVVW